jgi:hypothetical protein
MRAARFPASQKNLAWSEVVASITWKVRPVASERYNAGLRIPSRLAPKEIATKASPTARLKKRISAV